MRNDAGFNRQKSERKREEFMNSARFFVTLSQSEQMFS